MPKITFIDNVGTNRIIDVNTGGSLMQAAVNNQISGIDANCGGACACATCHVYIDAALSKNIPAAEDMELSMLEFADNASEQSRLSCQIIVTDEMDGTVFIVPEPM